MPQALAVLLVEDSKADALLLESQFESHGYDVQLKRVESALGFETALKEQSWDAIIADYALPRFSATAELAIMKQSGLDLPLLNVSGFIGAVTYVQDMNAGSH